MPGVTPASIGAMWCGVGAQATSPPWTPRRVASRGGFRCIRCIAPPWIRCWTSAASTRSPMPNAEELTLAWQRLQPWPDVLPGLSRLKTTYTLATLSNADVSTVVNISKRAGLPWDAIFAAEMAGVFKPDPAIYRMAATYLGLDPAEIMMVASHKYDIRAAGGLGFRTAFVARPMEFGTTARPTWPTQPSLTSTHLTSATLATNSVVRASAVGVTPPYAARSTR